VKTRKEYGDESYGAVQNILDLKAQMTFKVLSTYGGALAPRWGLYKNL